MVCPRQGRDFGTSLDSRVALGSGTWKVERQHRQPSLELNHQKTPTCKYSWVRVPYVQIKQKDETSLRNTDTRALVSRLQQTVEPGVNNHAEMLPDESSPKLLHQGTLAPGV